MGTIFYQCVNCILKKLIIKMDRRPFEVLHRMNGRVFVVKKDSYDGSLHHREDTGYQISGDDTCWFKNVYNRESYKLGHPADKYIS